MCRLVGSGSKARCQATPNFFYSHPAVKIRQHFFLLPTSFTEIRECEIFSPLRWADSFFYRRFSTGSNGSFALNFSPTLGSVLWHVVRFYTCVFLSLYCQWRDSSQPKKTRIYTAPLLLLSVVGGISSRAIYSTHIQNERSQHKGAIEQTHARARLTVFVASCVRGSSVIVENYKGKTDLSLL